MILLFIDSRGGSDVGRGRYPPSWGYLAAQTGSRGWRSTISPVRVHVHTLACRTHRHQVSLISSCSKARQRAASRKRKEAKIIASILPPMLGIAETSAYPFSTLEPSPPSARCNIIDVVCIRYTAGTSFPLWRVSEIFERARLEP